MNNQISPSTIVIAGVVQLIVNIVVIIVIVWIAAKVWKSA